MLLLLDHLWIDRAHFCGLSLGGLVAIWLGIHAPERLSAWSLPIRRRASVRGRVGAKNRDGAEFGHGSACHGRPWSGG